MKAQVGAWIAPDGVQQGAGEMPVTGRIGEASPRFQARLAGLFYLLTALTGIPDVVFVLSRLVVDGDPAATATNILAHQQLFELGFASALGPVVCYLVVTALFYHLFAPVSRSLALLAAFFSLLGCAIQAFACIFHLAPLVVLGGAPYLSVFTVDQLQALALMFLKLYGQAYNIGLIFFGCYCLLIGYLVFRSTFLPRILGVLMMFGGVGWLTFLSPTLAHDLFPYNRLPGVLGEGALTLWLLVVGVNVQRWQEQAGVARAALRQREVGAKA